MHTLRQYAGCAGLLTGLCRTRVQYLTDILMVPLAFCLCKAEETKHRTGTGNTM